MKLLTDKLAALKHIFKRHCNNLSGFSINYLQRAPAQFPADFSMSQANATNCKMERGATKTFFKKKKRRSRKLFAQDFLCVFFLRKKQNLFAGSSLEAFFAQEVTLSSSCIVTRRMKKKLFEIYSIIPCKQLLSTLLQYFLPFLLFRRKICLFLLYLLFRRVLVNLQKCFRVLVIAYSQNALNGKDKGFQCILDLF